MTTRRVISKASRALVSRQWCRHQATDALILEPTTQNSLKETQPFHAPNTLRPTRSPVQHSQTSDVQSLERVGNLNPVAETYYQLKEKQRQSASLGATVAPHYHPRDLVLNPPGPESISLELLLASQSHLGHATSLWHPGNAQYIFGIRDGIHIISLDVTAAHLRRAAKVVSAVAQRGGLILFVGTRAGQDRCIVKAAQLAGGCHLFEKWIPGTITNGNQLLARCKVQVVNEFDQVVTGFDNQIRDRPVLKPDLVVCLNPLENYVLLHECRTNSIPTIGIVDTDTNPTWVTYPIPANDDSLRCVQVIAGVLGRAGQQGRAKRLAAADEGHITFNAVEGLKAPTVKSEKEGDQESEAPFKFWSASKAKDADAQNQA